MSFQTLDPNALTIQGSFGSDAVYAPAMLAIFLTRAV